MKQHKQWLRIVVVLVVQMLRLRHELSIDNQCFRVSNKYLHFALVALVMLTFSFRTQGQYFAEAHWHKGRVELEDGKIHQGQLRYQLQENIVQFKSDDLVRSFNALQVEYFQFYDEAQDSVRHFYALEYDQQMQFFELLLNGALTLLNRQELTVRYVSGFGRFGTAMQTLSEVSNNFFLLSPKNGVQQLPTSRRAFVDELPQHRNQLDDFMQRNRIRLRQTADILHTLRFYNQLEKSR